MVEARELVVITSVPSFEDGSRVRLTQKLVHGLERYVEYWGGPVRVLLPPGARHEGSGNLDDVLIDKKDLPFQVDVVELGSPAMHATFERAALVLGGADYRLNGTASACRRRGLPYVFNSEYTLRTRWQIARTERKNLLRLARSLLWEWQLEQKYLREVREASGVQCNGTPTYEAYSPHSQHPLLYFDNRTNEDMLATPELIRLKAERRESTSGPLRLAFSGRLNPMKGADDLPLVAKKLAELGVDFTLDICGGGPSQKSMEEAVQRLGLGSRVRFRGILDFTTELLPFLRDEVDLFVCCHKQGDPSCTYVETFACGVPIVGYDNEAFAGLLRRVDAGFDSPLGDPAALAQRIARLSAPSELERWRAAADSALAFAREHTFAATFRRRIDHLRALVR